MAYTDILNDIKKRAAGAKPLGNTLKFDFGDQVVYIDGTGEENVVSEENKDSDTTLSLSLENFENLINGSLNPMMAVMLGKIKIAGDKGVAMKMQSLI